jgi:hypothetical protein
MESGNASSRQDALSCDTEPSPSFCDPDSHEVAEGLGTRL